jgi:ABC-type transporter Mla subunit MlaD
MPHHPVRNRVLAGGFLLVALAAGIAAVILIGGWKRLMEEKQTLRFRFDAAPSLKAGSPVLLAGHPVGRVDEIELVEVPCPVEARIEDKCYAAQVTVSVPKRFKIYANARVTVTQALVGQSAVLNIENVGYGKLAEGVIKGEQVSPFAGAAAELGIGEEEKSNIARIIKDLQVTIETVRKELPGVVDNLKTASANMAEVTGNAKETIDRVDTILDENREAVKEGVANARDLTAAANEKAGKLLDRLQASADKIEGILDENRPDVRKATSNLAAATEQVRTTVDDLAPRVRDASTRMADAMKDFRQMAADASTILATNRVRLTSTMQNFTETSEHLKALAKEVRRAPWRLFSTPDKKEVESLNLYDSARAFATAASDLDSVSDTLQILMEAKRAGQDVKPDLDAMLQRLEETYKTYQEAEAALLKEFERIQK